jgi:hypothetical protein
MMETDKELNHEPTANQAHPQGATRRRFLKGTTLALPAVVSLHSGTALAASSLGCGNFNGNTQSYASVLVPSNNPPSDNRLRVPVELYRLLSLKAGKPANNPANWKVVVADTGAYFKGNNVWRKVADGTAVTGNELAAVVAAAVTADNGNSNNMKTGTIKYAIVHVSTSSGAIVAVGSPVNTVVSGAIVTSWTGACLTSLYNVKLV